MISHRLRIHAPIRNSTSNELSRSTTHLSSPSNPQPSPPPANHHHPRQYNAPPPLPLLLILFSSKRTTTSPSVALYRNRHTTTSNRITAPRRASEGDEAACACLGMHAGTTTGKEDLVPSMCQERRKLRQPKLRRNERAISLMLLLPRGSRERLRNRQRATKREEGGEVRGRVAARKTGVSDARPRVAPSWL